MHRRNGVIVIGSLVAAVEFLSVPGQEMWRKVLQDSGHGLVFAVIGVVLALMREPRPGNGARSVDVLLQSFAVAVLIGVITEILQHFLPGRSMSMVDVMHDAAGAALGLALLSIVESMRPSPGVPPTSPASGRGAEPSPGVPPTSPASGRGAEPSPGLRPTSPASGRGGVAAAVTVALAALVVLAWQPIECATAYARRAAIFPILAEGGQGADLYFVHGSEAQLDREWLPAPFRRSGDERALRVRYATGARPKWEIVEPAPDWRGHTILAVDVTNPNDSPLSLVLWVLDEHHSWRHDDRLNLPVLIPPKTRTTVRVSLAAVESAPATRSMDMSRISSLALFARRSAPGTGFYVSRAWLE